MLLAVIDKVLRYVKGKDIWLGGVQVVVAGDFLQLLMVKPEQNFPISGSRTLSHFKVCVLNINKRLRVDGRAVDEPLREYFSDCLRKWEGLLGRARVGQLSISEEESR